MKPLSVLAYFDGRPGHEKQTQGVLNALSCITPVKTDSVRVPITVSTYLKNLAAYLLPFLRSPNQQKELPSVDLIIGTGTHTHVPMLLRKKLQDKLSGKKARAVTCMTPEKHLVGRFDLCCIPMHDQPTAGDNIFVTLGPPNTVKYGGEQLSDRGLVLVGGIDPKSHVWKSAEIISRIRIIIEKQPKMLWTVSSSPRTPEETCLDLLELAAVRQNVTFFRCEDTPSGWVEEQYALNRNVWVTADSISMVYEALTAGCSVGILPVEWIRQDNKFNKSLRYLAGEGLITDFDDWQAGKPMPELKDRIFDESKRCAEEILRRWWPDRLQ